LISTRTRIFLAACASIGGVSLAACGTLLGFDPLSLDPSLDTIADAAAGDAEASAREDAEVSVDARADAAPDGPRVLYEWKFDQGCGDWQPAFTGDLLDIETAAVRSAPGACRVCAREGGAFEYGIVQTNVVTDPDGGPVTLRAHVRMAPNSGGTEFRVYIYNPETDTGGTYRTLTTSYQAAEHTLRFQSSALFFVQGTDAPEGSCLVIDDVTVSQ
jgi:hypothetical protein